MQQSKDRARAVTKQQQQQQQQQEYQKQQKNQSDKKTIPSKSKHMNGSQKYMKPETSHNESSGWGGASKDLRSRSPASASAVKPAPNASLSWWDKPLLNYGAIGRWLDGVRSGMRVVTEEAVGITPPPEPTETSSEEDDVSVEDSWKDSDVYHEPGSDSESSEVMENKNNNSINNNNSNSNSYVESEAEVEVESDRPARPRLGWNDGTPRDVNGPFNHSYNNGNNNSSSHKYSNDNNRNKNSHNNYKKSQDEVSAEEKKTSVKGTETTEREPPIARDNQQSSNHKNDAEDGRHNNSIPEHPSQDGSDQRQYLEDFYNNNHNSNDNSDFDSDAEGPYSDTEDDSDDVEEDEDGEYGAEDDNEDNYFDPRLMISTTLRHTLSSSRSSSSVNYNSDRNDHLKDRQS